MARYDDRKKRRAVSRRTFLLGGAAAGAGLLVPWPFAAARSMTPRPPDVAVAHRPTAKLSPASLPKYVDQVPIPPRWTGGQLAARGLTMAESRHQFHRDLPAVPSWGYGGASYLGPTIDVQRGQPLRFTARNQLGPHLLGVDDTLHGPNHPGVHDQQAPRVSLHLHGGYTEPASDGYPEDTFTPGTSKVYHYSNDQQGGTIWYHDHALGVTRLNVYAGLAGFYLIREPHYEAQLPPRPFEIPLAIQDKAFHADGRLVYPDPWAPEFFGDVAVVNGKAWPNLDVGRGLYRFRLLNGSGSRFYNLVLDPPLPFYQIGTDTGLLPAPVELDHLVLAPGERADVLVDFTGRTPGERIRLLNGDLPAYVVSPADVELPEIMQFTVTRQGGYRGAIPATLRPFTALAPTQAVRERTVTLVEIMADDEPIMSLLNNRTWDTAEIEQPVVDTVEQWNILNLTADTHPIHLHLVQFQLVQRQAFDVAAYTARVYGTEMLMQGDENTGPWPLPPLLPTELGAMFPPDRYEQGWKDTIQAHPGMVTRVLVPFGPDAGAGIPFGQNHRSAPVTGEYVWHCHILDHEDNEMMLPYRVVGSE